MSGVKIVVDQDLYETRLVVVEDGRITGFYVERQGDESILGNVYLGKVARVIPGMQAAFVDIGLTRAAFLPGRQVLSPEMREALRQVEDPAGEEGGDAAAAAPGGQAGAAPAEAGAPARAGAAGAEGAPREAAKRARPRRGPGPAPIERSLKGGNEVIVQVQQQPRGMKGAKVTTYVSLPGHYCVFMPTIRGVGVSRRVTDRAKRRHLAKIANKLRQVHDGGFIMRTSSATAGDAEIEKEADYIAGTWEHVIRKTQGGRAPRLLFREWDLTSRMLRETPETEIDSIVVEGDDAYERVRKYLEMAAPHHLSKLSRHKAQRPIFDHFGIEQELERIFQRQVPLPSGGSIIIDQAEALTAIDVNTGSFTGKGSRDAEDTITKTNLEAVKAIAYQLKLRNIGGLIILDIIDMERSENREAVEQALRKELEKDRAKAEVRPISTLGLIEMTRERYGDSPVRLLNEKCWYCDGTGSILSKKTVAARILRAIEHTIAGAAPGDAIRVTAHQAVVLVLEHDDGGVLESLRRKHGRDIVLSARVDTHLEYFKVETERPSNRQGA